MKKKVVKKSSRSFEAQIKQLKRESLILVSFPKCKAFAQECFNRGIKVGVGDANDYGVILYKED